MSEAITDKKKDEMLNEIYKGMDIEEFEEKYSTEAVNILKDEGLITPQMSSGELEITTKGKLEYSIETVDKSKLPFFSDDGNKFVPMWMAECLQEDYHFATHQETEELYVYENGIYKPKGEVVVKSEAQRRLDQYVKSHYVNESLEAVRRANYTPPKKFNNPEDGIVVENGLLVVSNRELKDHSPEYIHLTKIPWKYDPEAECPEIKEFVSEIVNEGDEKLIQEMFGYCLLKDYPYAKAFMLLGSGANGKSTLLELLEKFLGNDNIANPSLQELLDNRFTKIDLFGKLANIHADMSSEELENTGTFKMLTGGDTIRGEKKYQDAIKFKNHAKLIYSANELPKTKDRTDAFFRRWIVIDFPRQFTGDEADENLPDKLINDEEMSGLLNWALDGLERIKEQGGFSHTDSRNDIKQKWIMQTDSLRGFLDIACEFERDAWTVKEDFQKIYEEFCNHNNIYSVKKAQVTKRLPTLKPAVSLYRPDLGFEGRPRCWKNLKIKESFIKEHDYVQDVQQMRTSSIVHAQEDYKKGSSYTLDKLDISNKIVTTLEKLEQKGSDSTVFFDDLLNELEENGMDRSEAEERIDKLIQDGKIFEPKPGQLKTT